MSLANRLLSFFFPEVCLLCDKPLSHREDLFCFNCKGALRRPLTYCRRCGELFSQELPKSLDEGMLYGCKFCEKTEVYTDFVYFGFFYEEKIALLIEKAKFHGDYVMAYKLGRMLRSILPVFPKEFDLACAVPLSEKRLKERSYNQAELMLWGYLGEKPRQSPLIRVKDTAPQTSLGRAERLKNVRSAFEVRGMVDGLRILLFDDVMTTGATLRECAKTLKQAGASKIYLLALARAPFGY